MYHYFPDYMEAIMEIERKYLIDEIPFDLKSDRLLLYSDTSDLHEKLYETLKNMNYVDN